MVISYDLFTELVRCSFLGGNQVIEAKQFTLESTILRKYDFLRSDPEFGTKTQMNRLFSELPSDFKGTAKSELYRKKKGWIEKSHNERKVKQYSIGEDIFLVPFLSKPSVGIDTSSNEHDTYVCIVFFDNHSTGYNYLEKYLKIPKAKISHGDEFKWNKLNPEHRKCINDNLEILLKISCTIVLMMKTNALKNPDEKLVDVFIKLINGWFTNYDYKSDERILLRKELFKLANETSIHCDPDFQPLTPPKIVKQFVKILADGNSFDPLQVLKESHESEPIQIADILCGALKQHIIDKNNSILTPWEFHNKLKTKTTEKVAKCYLWKFT